MKNSELLIKKFDTLDSTNRFATEELNLSIFPEFGIVWALEQTRGKGQLNAVWESEAGKNLTFSMIFHPTFLPPQNQFMLTKVLSLSSIDYLKGKMPNVDFKIKWPNDIYASSKKIIGMLVHNSVIGIKLANTVAGIGLNVNQENFSNKLPNPVSMKNLTGLNYNLEQELKSFAMAIIARYEELKSGNSSKTDADYLLYLVNYQKQALYLHNGTEKKGIIKGVTDLGFLQLHFSDGTDAECDMKEVKFLEIR